MMSVLLKRTIQSALAMATGMALAMAASAPCSAQEVSLYDTFSVALEGSWVGLNTNIRLDSKEFGLGTELDLESDLKLGDSKVVPSLSVEWRPWEKHRFGLFWKDVSRDSTAQALTEIRFEDLVIPIDAQVRLGFDIEEYGVAYTFLRRPKERSSFAFGGGLRILKLNATISASLNGEDQGFEGSSEAQVTGPLPFAGVEYRALIGERWRFQSDLGVFYIKIGDITGGQALLRASMEHLTFEHVGFGFGVGGSTVRISSEDESWRGRAKLGLFDVKAFVRIRM